MDAQLICRKVPAAGCGWKSSLNQTLCHVFMPFISPALMHRRNSLMEGGRDGGQRTGACQDGGLENFELWRVFFGGGGEGGVGGGQKRLDSKPAA